MCCNDVFSGANGITLGESWGSAGKRDSWKLTTGRGISGSDGDDDSSSSPRQSRDGMVRPFTPTPMTCSASRSHILSLVAKPSPPRPPRTRDPADSDVYRELPSFPLHVQARLTPQRYSQDPNLPTPALHPHPKSPSLRSVPPPLPSPPN